MTLLVSKRRFDETQIPDRARPHEGDLIYMPTDKRIYTITYVDYQAPGFLQAGIFPGYRLSCELYTPSHEQIQTEIKHIDEADKEMYSLDIPVTDIVGRFATNEKVVGSTSGFRGDVYKFYPRKKILSVNHLNGLFTAGETVTGESSGATATVTELVTHIGNKNSEIKSLETNEQLIDESNLIVEWDPNNPLA